MTYYTSIVHPDVCIFSTVGSNHEIDRRVVDIMNVCLRKIPEDGITWRYYNVCYFHRDVGWDDNLRDSDHLTSWVKTWNRPGAYDSGAPEFYTLGQLNPHCKSIKRIPCGGYCVTGLFGDKKICPYHGYKFFGGSLYRWCEYLEKGQRPADLNESYTQNLIDDLGSMEEVNKVLPFKRSASGHFNEKFCAIKRFL